MISRENSEQNELKILHPLAALSSQAIRQKPMEECEYRTAYQRDSDRIVYSRSFKRLAGKTQVFIRPRGDHYRTRMTHTHEVSRISRVIARCLGLNEDLAEAIALAHDIGHTPFGHAGERALQKCYSKDFNHESFGVTVVDKLENGGLNLTNEVRDGILFHSSSSKQVPYTLEGQVVRLADKIAYVSHDTEDILRAGIIKESNLPKDALKILGGSVDNFIDTMVGSTIEHSREKMQEASENNFGRPEPDKRSLLILMGEDEYHGMTAIRGYLNENIYTGLKSKINEEAKADRLIRSLFENYTKSIFSIPQKMKGHLGEFDIFDVAAFYIAGMTDRYAEDEFDKIFKPKGKFITEPRENLGGRGGFDIR
ncbi:MAG: HD domain-containing protein [Deltaproteobacteria bacterium]